MKFKKIGVLITLLAVMLTACTSNETVEPIEDEANDEVVVVEEPVVVDDRQYTDTINIPTRPIQTMNPLLNKDKSVAMMLKLIFFDVYEIDENLEQQKKLVVYDEFDYENNSVKIALSSNVYWADGVPITNKDFEYSLDTIARAEEDSYYKYILEHIVSYTKVPGSNNEIIIKYDNLNNLINFDLSFPIIPEHHYNTTEDVSRKPLGNGLYKLNYFEDYKNLSLVYNEYAQSEPSIKNINVKIMDNLSTELYAFEQGIIDVAVADLEEWAKYRIDTEANVDQIITNQYEFVGFNHDNVLLKDYQVRNMINMLLDREEITNSIYLHQAVTTNTNVNPLSWLYLQSDDNVYDVEKAKDIMLGLGYSDIDNDGYVEKMINDIKVPVTFSMLVNEENSKRVATAKLLKENCKNIGVEINITSVPFDVYSQSMIDGQYDIVIGGYVGTNKQDNGIILYSNEEMGIKNVFNYSNYAFNQKINQMQSATTREEYDASIKDIQNYIYINKPILSLNYKTTAFLSIDGITGVDTRINNYYNNIQNFTVKK